MPNRANLFWHRTIKKPIDANLPVFMIYWCESCQPILGQDSLRFALKFIA